MKTLVSGAIVCAAICLSTTLLRAQTLFSYEPGEPGTPYTGNPPPFYGIGSSTTLGVTNQTHSLTVTAMVQPSFGGPLSAAMDPTLNATVLANTNAINSASAVAIDMTVPNIPINFGNIDLSFFQAGLRGAAGVDETGFSSTFALSPGQTIPLQIPLTNTQFGSPRITLDPTLPWSYQIDISWGLGTGAALPQTFAFDNLRVVPEPASLLSISAIGALALARRRRLN